MDIVSLLGRRVMTAREAARQLRMPPATLTYWLEGGIRQGREYPPVLRPKPTRDTTITWGEMVEARYLRSYRGKNVPMQRLRPFIAHLRAEFGVPYPLAHFKPFIDAGKRLLLEVQEELDLPASLRAVYVERSGQLILDRRVDEFLERVDFAESGELEAQRLRPAGRQSPVVIDPRISSGAPTVQGTRTEVLAELSQAGVAVDDIAEDFGLPVEVVKAAVSYEWSDAA